METLIYIFDLVVLAVIIYYSYKNDSLKSGEAEEGPFRIKTQKNVTSDKDYFGQKKF